MKYLFGLTVLLLPTYVLKFSLFGFSTNVLMVWIFGLWVMFGLWLFYRKEWFEFARYKIEMDFRFKILLGLFLLAGTLSLFVGGFSVPKLGQFIVLVVQPVSVFMMLRYLVRKDESAKEFIKNIFYLFLGVSGLYAILQYFTLTGLPMDFWGNSNEPKRAVSFWIHPNFYSLFVVPVMAFLIGDLEYRIKNVKAIGNRDELIDQKSNYKNVLMVVAWVVSGVGLLLSLSRGGWIGLFFAGVVFLIVKANRKMIFSGVVVAVIGVVILMAVPNFRYRILLPFYGEKSAVARFSLWETGVKMISEAPVLGKGLAGFGNNWEKYNSDPNLEHYNFPHNIILNFWVDFGILGVLSMMGLFVYGIINGIKNRTNLYWFGLMLALVAIFTHGLIDIPYLKNDLAVVFWVLWGMSS
jgi:O-antigen ligase